jgi:hypothetical protein
LTIIANNGAGLSGELGTNPGTGLGTLETASEDVTEVVQISSVFIPDTILVSESESLTVSNGCER